MNFNFVRVSKRTYIRAPTSTAFTNSNFRRRLRLQDTIVRQCSTNGNGLPGPDDLEASQSDRPSVRKMIEVLMSHRTSHSAESSQPPRSLLAISSDPKTSPTIEFNIADNDLFYDPAVFSIILDRMFSRGHVLDIQIGTGRGIFDALSTSGLPNTEKLRVDNYDIGRDLIEHMVNLYGNNYRSNVMQPSPAMLNRITDQIQMQPFENQLNAISFTSCFHYFANLEHLRWIHSMLRHKGYAVFYWLYDPLLHQPPETPIMPRFSRTGRKIPGVKYPPGSKIVERLRELKTTLRRRLQNISDAERAALDERLLQITREFGEAYGTKPNSKFALQALMRIQLQLGDLEKQTVRKSMMESAVNSGNELAPDDADVKPGVWQVRMAETLGKYRARFLPSVSEGNWMSLLYNMEHLWELSGLFRMPPESHSRTFSMRVDLRSILRMWKEDPNFWHLDRHAEDSMLEELRNVLEDCIQDEDLDEYGRVNMVFGSHMTWLKKI
ncbi:uncharacterized protein V1513DRAFT_434931 [Lipomyces chichibuensis]|uniref:uncharacterized protein n=1 Tax=Lipomyces chichibuensis TaxID=1546026 RepID=UPI0033430156